MGLELITELNAKGDYINIGVRGFGNIFIENEHTFSTRPLKEKEPEASVIKQKGRKKENIDEREELFLLLRERFSKQQVKRVEGVHRLLQVSAKRSEVIDFIKEIREKKLWERIERDVKPAKLGEIEKEWKKSKQKTTLLKKLAKKHKSLGVLNDISEWYKQNYYKESFSLVNKIVTGHYTEMVRHKMSHPWSYYSIDDKLIGILEMKKEVDAELLKLKPKEKVNETTQKKIGFIKEKLESVGGRAEIGKDGKEKVLDVILSDSKNFEFKKYIRSNDLLNMKWCLIDIEKPRFDTDKEEVSWVAITYWQNGILKKEIHTTKNTGEEFTEKFFSKKNCEIFLYTTENEMVGGVNDSMNHENPEVFSSFNTPYDFIELRETDEGLKIGRKGAQPKKEVTTNFFQRLNLRDKLIIDPLNWAKIAKRWLPNQKLVMIAQELGHKFEKKISYRVMAELEDIIDGKKIKDCNRKTLHVIKDHTKKKLKDLIGDEENFKQICAQIIAYYVYDDTNILPEILFNPQMKKFYEHLDYICEFADVDIQKASHLPNSINNLQKKMYFETIGTHADAVYPTTKEKIKEESLIRAWVNRLKKRLLERIDLKTQRKMFDDVYHLVIPTWPFLRKELIYMYPKEQRPKIEKFFEYVISHKDNPEDFYTLSQYADSLCKPLALAWARYQRASEAHFKKLKKDNITFYDYDRLGRIMKELISETYEKHRIKNAYFTQEIIENCFDFKEYQKQYLIDGKVDSCRANVIEKNIKELNKIVEESALDLRSIQDLANEWLKLRKKWIHVLVPFAKDPELMYIQNWEINFDIINEQLKKYNLDPVHKRDNHLYVKGNPEDLESFLNKIPVIHIDTLDKALVAQNPSGGNKIYYPKHGFYRGVKIQDEPSKDLSVLEMRIHDKFLKLIFDGKLAHSVEYMRNKYRKIRDRFHLELEVPNKNLVRYIKDRKRYKAFVIGRDTNAHEIEFCEKSDKKTRSDSNLKMKYFTDFVNSKFKRIYVSPVKDLPLHYESYKEKILKQIECLATPISKQLDMMPEKK